MLLSICEFYGNCTRRPYILYICKWNYIYTRVNPLLSVFQKHRFTFSFPPLLKQPFYTYCGAEHILNDLCGKGILGGMMCPIYTLLMRAIFGTWWSEWYLQEYGAYRNNGRRLTIFQMVKVTGLEWPRGFQISWQQHRMVVRLSALRSGRLYPQ